MDRMRQLVDLLNQYAYQYHVLDAPSVSDAQYDKLFDELMALEESFGVILSDSPTKRVGGEPIAAFEPHTHLARLWSMDKVQSFAELDAWLERTCRALGVEESPELALEYKYDGLAINLTYEDGVLVQAATRGNGVRGESILNQVMTIKSIPLKVAYRGRFEVKGEGIMRLSALEDYNKTAQEPLKNVRNGVAGALRNLDPKVTAQRNLSAFFYSVGYIEGRQFANHREMMAFIGENRLPMGEYIRYTRSAEELKNLLLAGEEGRNALDYQIDGMVISICDMQMRERLGYTSRFPKWTVAYKFKAQEMTTRVLEVVWDAGRSGKLTPVAILEPVDIGGATVRRATLNNYDDIQRKQVAVGRRVWIRRSNDVIPEIMGSLPDDDDADVREIPKPEVCPVCGANAVQEGVHIFCPNALGCPAQVVSRLKHFASRNAMDIETFSGKTAEMFFEQLGMRDIADLYELQREDLLDLPGFGDKRADNLLGAINNSKHIALERFVYALGIPGVGEKTARDLAANYGSLEAISRATQDELVQLRDIGEVVAQSITAFFGDEHTREIIGRMLDCGVSPIAPDRPAPGGALEGKTVVVTGTLPTLSRKQAEQLIVQHGGRASGSVSKNTAFVLAGDAAGSKLTKAVSLGVAVVDEAGFLAMLGE